MLKKQKKKVNNMRNTENKGEGLTKQGTHLLSFSALWFQVFLHLFFCLTF